jgi:Tfp pilus assembly protein PilW
MKFKYSLSSPASKRQRSSASGFGEFLRDNAGFTVAEVMVSATIGLLFVVGIVLVFTTSSLGFARMGDYLNMDRSSRNALDQMTRNIRRAKLLTSFDSANLVFSYDSATAATTNLAYRYNSSAATVTEEWTSGGVTTTNTLLTGCSNVVFSLLDHSLASTTDVSAGHGKVVSVSWTSHGTTRITQPSTETMQQADIVIRNQP